MDTEQAVRDFKVLGMLCAGDKLGIDAQDRLYIDRPSRFQWLRRWYCGNNRERTLRLAAIVVDVVIMQITALHA